MWWRKKKNEELNIYIEQLQILKKANLELRNIYAKSVKLPIAKDLIKITNISENTKRDPVSGSLHISYMLDSN